MTKAPSRLRQAIARGGLVTAPGAHDALSARVAADAGFEALYLGANALGLSLGHGQPFVTLTETVEAATRIARASDACLIVDAGAGFGDAPHVRHAVRAIEASGAAALHIDDQPYPKPPAYHRGRGRLAPVEHAAARLRVAAEARRDPDLMLIARTDALRVTKSLDETLARARAYLEAGADALMVLDLGPERASALREAFPETPLVWIGGVAAPAPSLDELARAGFALAVYPFNAVAAVTAALSDLWAGLRADGQIHQPGELLDRMRAETLRLADLQPYWDIEDRTRP